ncbi:MAG TPA: pyridoxamine 5'-phosphate oxidase family protein [Steroidobacteraceae bacterium]
MSQAAFHPDELAAQAHAGVAPMRSGIRDLMPEQHRGFFAALPYLLVAASDRAGWPLATLLEGEPGFVTSPDPGTLRIEVLPGATDPAARMIRCADDIGLLGVDFVTRRRNRANGIVSRVDADGFTVAVKQSFGNCPQYIQRRAITRVEALAGEARELASLDSDAFSLIERADTFFVASRSRADAGPNGGADISHRGGRPGFVRIEGDTLLIPDFRGNRYFNTLGNLIGEPRSSLLFLDFDTGDVLQLQGLASVDWDAGAAGLVPGAERTWRFRIARGWFRPRAAATRGTFIEYSPVTLRTGAWAPRGSRASAGTI